MFEGTWKDSKPFKGILKLHPQQSLLSKILKTEEKQKEKKGEISIFLNEKMKYSKIVYPDGRIYEG